MGDDLLTKILKFEQSVYGEGTGFKFMDVYEYLQNDGCLKDFFLEEIRNNGGKNWRSYTCPYKQKIDKIVIDTTNGYDGDFQMSIDSYFKYFEYIKLQETRQASRIAQKFATAALVISIVVGAFSCYFSWEQIKIMSDPAPQKVEIVDTDNIFLQGFEK